MNYNEGYNMDDLRIYCLIRQDINMPLGKMIAQSGHAFMGAMLVADQTIVDEYLSGPFTKISKWTKNLDSMLRAKKECDDLGLPVALITDSGRTVFNEPTVTCLGIGPVKRSQLPKFVDKMRLVD